MWKESTDPVWEGVLKEYNDAAVDAHYKKLGIEPITVVEKNLTRDERLGYYKGTALKYLMRHPHKGRPIEDLNKCIFFINRLINEYYQDQNNPPF